MVRRFDVYCNGGWDGCTTYEEDCDCGDYVSAVDYADLVEAVRWERECCQDIRPLAAWGDLYVRHGEDYVDGVADDLRAIQDAARAAVDALVGGENAN